jgi:putative oxidoreductase
VERFLHRYTESAYLVLRLGVAFLFIFHAPQKWLGWFGGPQFPAFSIRGLASLIEAVCSPLIALGLFTSYAAFFAAAEMVGAYVVVHLHVLPRPGWPIENRGELSVLYFFVFVYLMVRGGGKYSLDRTLRGVRS